MSGALFAGACVVIAVEESALLGDPQNRFPPSALSCIVANETEIFRVSSCMELGNSTVDA